MSLRLEQLRRILDKTALALCPSGPCPVPLRQICQRVGVRGIRRDNLQTAKSLLIDARVNPVIVLNESLISSGRQQEKFTRSERFLIAHEIGHLVLYQAGAEYPAGKSEYWKLEGLCDAFARRLLIPDVVVKERKDFVGFTAIDRLNFTFKLAQTCSVPWSAVAQRLSEIDAGVVFFRVETEENDDFKIVVSTRHNHLGRGQRIRPGTPLHKTISGRARQDLELGGIEVKGLAGIGGMKDVQSAAARSLRGAVCLAVIPS